jgi:hypothetical protein
MLAVSHRDDTLSSAHRIYSTGELYTAEHGLGVSSTFSVHFWLGWTRLLLFLLYSRMAVFKVAILYEGTVLMGLALSFLKPRRGNTFPVLFTSISNQM